MSSDLDLVERLRTDPAPAMHVDLAAVVAEGRRRHTRRTVRVAALASAAVAAAAVVAVVLHPFGADHPALPADTSTVTSGPVETHQPGVTWEPSEPGLSGSAVLTGPGGSYAVSVARGVLAVAVTRGGATSAPVKAAVQNGGAWRVVDGTAGFPVVVGVAPAGASEITYLPVDGAAVLPHQVSTVPAGDFTAYVLTFDDPPSAVTLAADVGWRFPGLTRDDWTLAVDGQQPESIGFGVSMEGESATPLTPDGFTVTGPAPTGATGTESVVLSIVMSTPRLGTTVQAQLQADTVVTDADALVATFTGRDPDTALAYRTFQVRGGPSVVWGVLPPGSTSVTPHLEGGARAGVPVLQRMGNGLTAFAVMVQGNPSDVTGLEATLGGGRGTLSVLV
jgi:hypothetical protein